MTTSRIRKPAITLSLLVLFTSAAAAQQQSSAAADEDFWPCVQRKVPELSLPQIWNGPALPEEASKWPEDREISNLVRQVAQRRISLEEAEQQIRDFAEKLPPDQRDQRLLMVVRGLFDLMNRERSDVMISIERFTKRQIALADSIRKELAELEELSDKPDVDTAELERRREQVNFTARAFQDRNQSITFVCEVPTIIEQRLYRLANSILPLLNDRS